MTDKEQILEQLFLAVAASLLDKIQEGKATPQDYKTAVDFLKQNGINCEVTKGDPLDILAEELPVQNLKLVNGGRQ